MKKIRLFKNNDLGIAAVEFALILPLLVFFWLGSVVVFDAFKVNRDLNFANDMIANITARHSTVNDSKIAEIFAIGKGLLPDNGKRFNSRLRLTSIEFIDGKYQVMWSKSTGGFNILADYELKDFDLPILTEYSTLIISEVELDFVPMLELSNIGKSVYQASSYRRPRFVEIINYE